MVFYTYINLCRRFVLNIPWWQGSWGPSGTDRAQVGPMLVPRTLLSGNYCSEFGSEKKVTLVMDRNRFPLLTMICGYPQGLHHLHELNPPKNMDVAPASMFALHSNISFPFCWLWEPILWYYPAHLFRDIGTFPYGLIQYWKVQVLPCWSTKYTWRTLRHV